MGKKVNSKQKKRKQTVTVDAGVDKVQGQANLGVASERDIGNTELNKVPETVKSKRLKKEKKSKGLYISVICLCCLLILYFSMVAYFSGHFYFGSTINCISVSGKTVEQVNEEIPVELQKYRLDIEERNGVKEEIKASDIGLKYDIKDKVSQIKDNQNPFGWIYEVFSNKTYSMSSAISYDDSLLRKKIDGLECFKSNKITKPKSPSFKYTDKGYEVVKEVVGNEVNKTVLYNKIEDALLKGETNIDLEAMECYNKPKYKATDKEVLATKSILNKYVATKITYEMGNAKENLDGSIINTWLKVDDNLNVVFDNDKVKKYVETLAANYDTCGKTRSFVNPSGQEVKVSGGDYGWKIDKTKELQALTSQIKEGKVISKEPIYSQKAKSHDKNDIGNTYVDINLTTQTLCLYKNGSLVVNGKVVTGNVSLNNATPQGTYKVNSREKNATLRGQDYNCPVGFWMPFNAGIGMHDATWRREFGGEIYKTSGSHGCINCPYDLAQSIYNNIEVGTPVVCHY